MKMRAANTQLWEEWRRQDIIMLLMFTSMLQFSHSLQNQENVVNFSKFISSSQEFWLGKSPKDFKREFDSFRATFENPGTIPLNAPEKPLFVYEEIKEEETENPHSVDSFRVTFGHPETIPLNAPEKPLFVYEEIKGEETENPQRLTFDTRKNGGVKSLNFGSDKRVGKTRKYFFNPSESSPHGCEDKSGFHFEGETWYSRGCQRHKCLHFGGKYFVETDSCDVEIFNTTYKCIVRANLKEDYPRCCPRYVCNPDNLGNRINV